MRHRAGLLVSLIVSTATGCLITTDPQFDPPPGEFVKGSMMCSVCWYHQFCLDPGTGEFVEGSDCPDGFVLAEQANRVISSVDRLDDFYCIVPDGKTLGAPPIDPLDPTSNPDQVLCHTASDPAAHQFLDPCQDVPISCRTAPLFDPEDLSCAAEDLPDPSEPMCDIDTEVGPERYACGPIEDTALAVGKLISAVSVYGLDVPDGDAPERYCFLSCYEDIVGGCDEELVDPPEVRTTSLTASVDPVTASALVSIVLGGVTDSDSVLVEGELAFDVPLACRGPLPPGETASCEGALSMIDLRSVGELSLAGEAITGIRLHIPVPLATSMRTIGNTTTIVTGQSLVYVLGTIGSYGSAGAAYEVEQGLELTVDWSTGEIQALTTLKAADGSSDLLLDISGPLLNQPPIADAGRDQVLECNGQAPTASVSASTSFDADGASELTSFTWSSVLDGVRRTSNGMDWVDAPVADVGTTYFTVVVGDNDAASDTDTVAVTVEDTVAPTFTSTNLATSCLWPPNGDLLLFELGDEIRAEASDACDGAASIEILTVTSSQPASGGEHGNTSPDVVYGPGAFCIRAERTGANQAARVYTVIVAATDEAGNITTRQLTVRVPYRASDVPGCATPSSIEAVAPTDPRCSAP